MRAHDGVVRPRADLRDRAVTGGNCSTYFSNGRVYGSEIYRGFDVHKLVGVKTGKPFTGTLNAQTQVPLGQ
jgi:hypothetical protein